MNATMRSDYFDECERFPFTYIGGMADYFFLLRSVEVQTVRDIKDQNHHRICFATLGAGLPINLLTSG
jgi:hypothetical protein